MVYLSHKNGEAPQKEGKKMTQTANHMMRISSKHFVSANGKVNVQKIGDSWIVGKNIAGSIYYGSIAGFATVREALVFAEGVEA